MLFFKVNSVGDLIFGFFLFEFEIDTFDDECVACTVCVCKEAQN